MKRLVLAAVLASAVVAASVAAPAAVQFQKPEDAIKYRKATFVVMQNHLARIGTMVKGEAPYDPPTAAAAADIVNMMAQLPFHAYVEGSTGDGAKNSAKPSVWSERPKFDEGAKKLQAETAKLVTATRANNMDLLKAAYGATTNSCKVCHDSYRVR